MYCKNSLFTTLILIISCGQIVAQSPKSKHYFGFGVQASYHSFTGSYPQNNFPLPSGNVTLGPDLSLGVEGVYVYQPQKVIGLETGLNLRWLRAGNSLNLARRAPAKYRNLLVARVPAHLQINATSWLALELGLGSNFILAIGNELEYEEEEFQSVFLDFQGGLRFNLFAGLSLSLAYNRSVTPVSTLGTFEGGTRSFRAGLRYMF